MNFVCPAKGCEASENLNSRHKLSDHLYKECDYVMVKCTECDETLIASKIEVHRQMHDNETLLSQLNTTKLENYGLQQTISSLQKENQSIITENESLKY